jgi:hypothetical protein
MLPEWFCRERSFFLMNMSREDARSCVGPGWASLIDAIYDRLPEDAYILQVKEKWGGLRFYVDGTSELLDFISEMENKSLEMCEVCGQPGKPREGGWIRTLCEEHYRESFQENIRKAAVMTAKYKSREDVWTLIEEIQKRFEDYSPDEIESMVNDAIRKARAEKSSPG